jgi:hypothetical protein
MTESKIVVSKVLRQVNVAYTSISRVFLTALVYYARCNAYEFEHAILLNNRKGRQFVRGLVAYKTTIEFFRYLGSNSDMNQPAPLDCWLHQSTAQSFAHIEELVFSTSKAGSRH